MSGLTLRSLGVLAVTAAIVEAEISPLESPDYGVIVARNAFGLSDPPPPPSSAPPTNAAPVKSTVQLSGVSVGGQGKYAWLVLPAAPPARTNSVSWKLREGESQDGIKILEINEAERSVKLLNGPVTEVLTLRDNAPVNRGPAITPTMPGAAPGMVAPGMPVPAANVPRPGVAQPAVPGGGAVNLPSAVPAPAVQRVGSAAITPSAGGINPGAASMDVAVGGGMRTTTIPARPVRTAAPEVIPESNLDPAQQYLMLRAQEAAASQQGIPFPPTPPVPMR